MKKIIVAMMIAVLAVCSIAAFAGCQSYDYTVGVSQFENTSLLTVLTKDLRVN